jgi:hypothetical protein
LEGDPDLGGAAVAVVAFVALQAAGIDECGECAVDLAGFLVAAVLFPDALCGQAVAEASDDGGERPGGGVFGHITLRARRAS